MYNEQQQIIDEAYENYCTTLIGSITFSERGKHFKSNGLEFNSGYPNYVHYSKEEFINKCKTNPEFSERWGLKIEERHLTLEERLEIADKFNPLIREACLTKTHHPDETEELKLIYRHEWLDSLGSNVVPQRKLITITYNDKKIESYK